MRALDKIDTRRTKTADRWFKENLEAIAIAVVMALVIRQFAIEAFKIPTESMAPTLYGEELGGGTGDRILVDKIGPLISGVDRFDVIVFKYPLNEARNYIKRLVGLGGETLSIRDGDVWIDGRIARKPSHVQEVLWFPVWPHTSDTELPFRYDETFWKRDGRALEADCPGGESFASMDGIRDRRPWEKMRGTWPVGDVRLTLEVTPRDAGSYVVLRIQENGTVHDLVLAVGGGESWLVTGETKVAVPDTALEAGETTEVSFANVDDTLRVEVDGERFVYEFESDGVIAHDGDHVACGVNQGAARFSEIVVERDIHYVSEGYHRDVKIPEDCLFMLGDNSRTSKDSRAWQLWIYEMKDGTEYRRDTGGDEESRPRRPEPGLIVFQDEKGIMRTIREEDILHERSRVAPFVPKENVIGHAFFVFWPLNPFREHMLRTKFIR